MDRIKALITEYADDCVFSEYDCGESNRMLLCENISEEAFMSVVSDFRLIGTSETQTSSIGALFCYTFKYENQYIVFCYDKVVSEMRIISDPYSSALNTEINKAGKCPVRMWQFEVDHTLIDCGMCYIIQCSDYSFVVIDSAHAYSLNDDVRLYEFLKKETPEGMPVIISAWYLSHGHADHICKCLDFITNIKDVTVKGLYYNFVPDSHFSAEEWLIADRKHTELFNREIQKRIDIPKYKLHTGQYFYIDCLRFDILCSHEDVFPQSLEDYNNSSLVAMMTVGGDKVCFPGDASGKESIILERRYADFLKCDIMQVSHHGHFGTSSEFYKMADAYVALFPVTQIKYDEEFPRIEANRVAVSIAKHTFIAANGTVMFTFPLKNSKILVYPDETNESFEGIYNLWCYDYTDEFKKENIDNFNKRNKFIEIDY